MREAIVFFVLLILMIIQAPLLHWLDISSISVDIALLGTLHFVTGPSWIAGLILSSLLGLLQDFLTPGSLLGLNMEAMAAIYILSRLLFRRVPLERPIPLIIAVLICSLFKALLFLLLSLLFMVHQGSYTALVIQVASHAAITAALAPVISFTLLSLDQTMNRRHRGKSLLR